MGEQISRLANFTVANFTFIGATCRPCGAKNPFLDHWVKTIPAWLRYAHRRRHRVVVEDHSVAPVWSRRMAARHRSAGGRWWSWRSWSIQRLRGRPELRTQSRSGRLPTDASTCSLSAWWAGMLGDIFSPRAQRWLHVVSWCSPSLGAGLYVQRPRHCERDAANECGESAVDSSRGRPLVS